MYDIKILARRVLINVIGGLVIAGLLLFMSRFFPAEMAVKMQTKAFEMVMGILGSAGVLAILSDLEKFFSYKDTAKQIKSMASALAPKKD